MEWYGRMGKDTGRYVNYAMIQAARAASRADRRTGKFCRKFRKRRPYGIAVSHVANGTGIITWYVLQDRASHVQRSEEPHSKKILRVAA